LTAGQTPSQPTLTPRHVGSPYAYEWFVRAELLRARGQLEPAIDAYRLALSSSDEDPYVLARLATALDAIGARGQADAALADAFTQQPYSEVAWLARAEIAEHRGELSRALEAYERAESAAPSSPRAPLALAALLDRQGQPERARAVLLRYEARVLPVLPGAGRARLRRALLARDANTAFAEARAQLRTSRPDVAGVTEAAALQLAQGRCALALELLDATRVDPTGAALRLRALLACAHFTAAEELLRTHDPEWFGGLLEVARAYLALGRADEARDLALDHRASHPDDLSALLVLAQAQLARGAYAEAAELFSKLPAGARGHAEAQRGLVQALQAQGLRELAARVAAESGSEER
jgi:tetratricopeptide (TPR) repeat protein